jgi:hypothetical protein
MSEPAGSNGKPRPVQETSATRTSTDDIFAELPWLRPNKSTPEERSYEVVARAVQRAQTRALIFEHLAQVAGEDFRGSDVSPARMLLTVPGGGPFPARLEDVRGVEQDLRELGDIERQKIARLMDGTVRVEPSDVDPPRTVRGIGARFPQNGRVEQNDVELRKKEIR